MSEKLAQIQQQLDLGKMYQQAQTQMAAKDWAGVLKTFEQIASLQPDYPDQQGLLAEARAMQAEIGARK